MRCIRTAKICKNETLIERKRSLLRPHTLGESLGKDPGLREHCRCRGKAGETLCCTPLAAPSHWGCRLKGCAGSGRGMIPKGLLCCLNCTGVGFHAGAIAEAFFNSLWGNETHVWEEQHSSSAVVNQAQFIPLWGTA